ncbi:MAG: porin [Campylobacterales bacterium]|nr:porin [Campylobacterales bacterium]
MFFRPLVGVTLLVCLGWANEELRALEERVAELTKRVDAQQTREQNGNFESADRRSVISVGGRIDLQAALGWPEGSLFAGKIPLSSEGENAQLQMSARDSRFWIKSRTPTPYGPARALIELDFWGSSGDERNTNSHNPRLRHAYVTVGGFTIGQTNSAFNSLVTLDTIEFVINDVFVRQPLVRYTIEKGSVAYDLSFEQPETTLIDKNASIITPQDDQLPDLVAALRYYPAWGEASFALLFRRLSQDRAQLSDGTQLRTKDAAFGYGANLSAKILAYKQDDLRFDLQYGLGLGRYMAYNAFAAGFVDEDGAIELQKSYGAHLGYRHFWTQNLRSTLAYAYAATHNSAKIQNNPQSANKSASSLQANLFWTPFANTLTGLEYFHGTREVQSADSGKIDLARLVFRYEF